MNRNKQTAAQSSSSTKSVDPLREKLKAWQSSHGRFKENKLPWQPRYRKVINEIDGTTELRIEKNERLPTKPPTKPSKPREQPPKTPSKRTVLSSQENKTHDAEKEKENERRSELENWKKMKFAKNVKDVRTRQIKNRISHPVVASDRTRKPSINFIERNIEQAGQRKTIARRSTVADMHLKARRSSLEKVRRHSHRNRSNYYCLKPEVSRKLANSVKKAKTTLETSKLDVESIIGEDFEDSKATGFSARRGSLRNGENTSASPKLKQDDVPLPPSHKSSGRQEIEDDCNALINFVSTPMTDREPLKPTTSGFFHGNLNMKYLLSPVKHLSKHNLYSLTPVRRSTRLSAVRKSIDVFEFDKIPVNLLSNALYRENPALNILMEDGDDDDGDDCI